MTKKTDPQNPYNLNPLVTHDIECIARAIGNLKNNMQAINAHSDPALLVIRWQMEYLAKEFDCLRAEVTVPEEG